MHRWCNSQFTETVFRQLPVHEVTRGRIGLLHGRSLLAACKGDHWAKTHWPPGDGKGSKGRRRRRVMIFLFLSFPGFLCRNKCVSLPGGPNHWCGLPAPGTFSSGDFLESPHLVHSLAESLCPWKQASHRVPGNPLPWKQGKIVPFSGIHSVTRSLKLGKGTDFSVFISSPISPGSRVQIVSKRCELGCIPETLSFRVWQALTTEILRKEALLLSLPAPAVFS